LKASDTVVLGIHGGGSIDKEDRVRICSLLALTLLLGACGFLDQIYIDGPSLNPNKIYLNRADIVTVGARETSRYACVDRPLECVSRGVGFDCRCP
jgi:hypothetical protein